MTDTQLLTLVLAVIIPLSLLIYSNTRVTDAKETLRAELKTLDTSLRSEIQTLGTDLRSDMKTFSTEIRADIKTLGERMETQLKIHELEHHPK